MQLTEMIDVVQQRAGIDSTQAANDTLIAVAETLAEREMDGAQSNLAAQLPAELSTVVDAGDKKSQEAFDADEFIRRVGQKLGTSPEHSETRTRAAFSIMLEGVSEGERLDMLNALPNDLTPYATWDTSAK